MSFSVQAAMEYGAYYNNPYGSRESLYSTQSYRLFTPPATKPKNNIFFNSDDSLFKGKQHQHRFTIPRIEIVSDEPVFNLQVTDFSEPSPKNVTLTYDETGINMKQEKIEEYCVKPIHKNWKDKTNDFVQQKSFSIEVNDTYWWGIDDINEGDKFLSIGARRSRQKLASSSLQDLSSSTSSVNSCVHESNFDLSQIDAGIPIKHKTWKSPYEIRLGKVKDLADRFENKATSVPMLSKKRFAATRSKSVSEEQLNNKLTEYERLEILKLLHDWSLNGSESKSEFNLKLSTENLNTHNFTFVKPSATASLTRSKVKFSSEPNLSPPNENSRDVIVIAKFRSDNSLSQNVNLDQFNHKCQYRNCIFNIDFIPKRGTKPEVEDTVTEIEPKPKGILKPVKDIKDKEEVECLNNITNLQKKPKYRRRFSEVIEAKPFNSQLVRCDSLERLTDINSKKYKKFPESYIVTRRNSTRKQTTKNDENVMKSSSPKMLVMRRKYLPKTWKSCSDIKTRKTVRKCCRNAKVTCPVSRDSPKVSRKTQSCACIEREQIPQKNFQDSDTCQQRCCVATAVDSAARLAAFKGAFNRKITITAVAHIPILITLFAFVF